MCISSILPVPLLTLMVILQLRTAGSNMLFTAVTEISDSVLKGAEASGFNGMVKLALYIYVT